LKLKKWLPRGIIHGTQILIKKGATMKVNTKQRKKARKGFEQGLGKEEMLNRMFYIIQTGKQGLDVFIHELGAILIEAIMDMEREELSGP
jgi:hypothetical protein